MTKLEREIQQKAEVKKTNALIGSAKGISQQLKVAIEHNLRGQEEGWLEAQDGAGRNNPYHISPSFCINEHKISKSGWCPFSLEIELNIHSLKKEDIPFLKQILAEPKYWWREHERIDLWNVINALTGRADHILLLDEIKLKEEVCPPLSMIGKLVSSEEQPHFSESHPGRQYFNWAPAPNWFHSLVRHCYDGLLKGIVEFNLELNGIFYSVEFYSTSYGGNARNLPRQGHDLIVTQTRKPDKVDFKLTAQFSNAVLFQNLARKLRAKYKRK